MADRVTFVRATRAHCCELAAVMRPADRAEIQASRGRQGAEEVLLDSLAGSEVAFAAHINGELAAVGGMELGGGMLGSAGRVWMLTSEVVNRHPVAFVRASRGGVAELRRRYPSMFTMVDARYGAARRWLAALGFEEREMEPYGARGAPFVRMTLGG